MSERRGGGSLERPIMFVAGYIRRKELRKLAFSFPSVHLQLGNSGSRVTGLGQFNLNRELVTKTVSAKRGFPCSWREETPLLWAEGTSPICSPILS